MSSHPLTNALIEGAGSPAVGALIREMKRAGLTVVAVDLDPHASGFLLADSSHRVPAGHSPEYHDRLLEICRRERVGLLLPATEEGLGEWARQAPRFAAAGTTVLVSPEETIALCADKWEFYQFFNARCIPLPRTSLRCEHPLIKPRTGHGGAGVFRTDRDDVDMTGRISQEFLEGEEFSSDVLCDLHGRILTRAIRIRLRVEAGVSVAGLTVDDPEISGVVDRICALLPFRGPINIQFIRTARGVFCTEINPRLGGGLSMSMAASTGNWFQAIVAMTEGREVEPFDTRPGLLVGRYYADVTGPSEDLAPPDGLPVTAPGGPETRRTYTEARRSPCAACPTSPCCAYVPLDRIRLDDIASVDQARFLLNHDRVELGVNRSGAWRLYYLSACRFLHETEATCRIHGQPDQPLVCVHYNPFRCWYKRALTAPVSDEFLRVDRPRLEFILPRLQFDEHGRIVDVPDWPTLQEGFRDNPPAALPAGPPAQAELALGPPPSAAGVPPGAPPDAGVQLYTADSLPDPCLDCGTYCCSSLVINFGFPASFAHMDHLKFLLGFQGIELGISHKDWVVIIRAPCRHLSAGRCAIFGQPERPKICVYTDAWRCQLKSQLGPFETGGVLRVSREQYPRLLELCRFDSAGQLVRRPSAAELRAHIDRSEESANLPPNQAAEP